MTKQNKSFKIIFALICFLGFSVSVLAVQAPPVTGIGVVVKKNPGGGASKATTGKDGSFSLEVVKGSYLISLDKAQLMNVGQELVKAQNPKNNYLFNGDGTQLIVAENENIIMSQLESSVDSDLILITVKKPTTLRGSLLWDDTVINQPQTAGYVGHVTLLKRNAAQKLQVFCPTGTIGLDGKCVPIKELENTPAGNSEAYVGHVTLLKKNSSALRVTATTDCPQGFELKNGNCVPITTVAIAEGIGHVTLLKKNITAIRLTSGTDCPEGFEMKNGECVPITTVTTTSKTDGIGHVTLLKKNITAIRVTSGTDCPEGLVLKNGECVPITTVTEAKTAGGPIGGIVVNGGSNGGTHKVKRTGHVTLLRFTHIYIGGGVFSPSTTTKEAGVVNGIDINLGVYQPIWAWEQSNISLGFNAGGSYTTGNGDYTLDNRYTVYQLQGQSAPPVVSEKGAGSPKNQGFKFEAGPQMNIHLGDITVSPILNAAYLSISQKAFAVTETVQENTVDYPYDLLTQKATKTNGLGIIPKIRLVYNITPRIGIWIEGSYIMGPKIETESIRFVLDPTIPSDSYNLGHFNEGQYITTKTKTKYSALGINGGIVISIGGTAKTDGIGHVTLLKKNGQSIKVIECPPGFTMNNGKCELIVTTNSEVNQRWTPIVPKPQNNVTYTISNGMLNGKKELLDKNEVIQIVKSIQSNESSIQTIEIQVVNDKPVLVTTTTNEVITIPLYQENGYLMLSNSATVTIVVNNKPTTTVKEVNSNKHDYVGHVTLLR